MIKLANIYKSYNKGKDNEVSVLKGIDLEFPDTGLIFIVGKSGSGKSTLLNILGLLDKFDEGEYFLDDKSIKTFSEKEEDAFRALNVGFVFQEFNIIEKYSIGENITLPLDIAQMDLSREQIEELLTRVGLEGYYDRFAGDISGGQKQRVAMARALIKNPKIILADEPTGALDSKTSGEIFDLLSRLSKEKLIIVVSHDMDSAYRFGDKVIEIRDGQIGAITDGDSETRVTRITAEESTLSAEQIQQVEKAIKKGEKVLISPVKKAVVIKPKTKKKEEPKEALFDEVKQNPKLSFKAIVKIAMLSMKSKKFRFAFTVIFSSIVIAVLGFMTVLTSFDRNRIIYNEWGKAGVNFAFLRAGYMDKNDNELLSYWDEKNIDNSFYPELEKFNLPYTKAILNVFQTGDIHREFFVTNSNGRNTSYGYYDYYTFGFYEIKDFSKFAPKFYGDVPNLEPTLIPDDKGMKEVYEVAISNTIFNSLVEMQFDSWEAAGDVDKEEILTYEDLFDADILLQYGKDNELIGLPSLTRRTYFKVVAVCEFDISQFDRYKAMYEEGELKDLSTDDRREFGYFASMKTSYLNYFYLPAGTYYNTPLKDAYDTASIVNGSFSFSYKDLENFNIQEGDYETITTRVSVAQKRFMIDDIFNEDGSQISNNIILKNGLTKETFEEYKTGEKIGIIISSHYMYSHFLDPAELLYDDNGQLLFNTLSLAGVNDYLVHARDNGMDILGSKINYKYTVNGEEREIEAEIIGVWYLQGDYTVTSQSYHYNEMFLTKQFFEQYNTDNIANALVFFENGREFMNFLNKIKDYTFEITNDDVNIYRFQINMGGTRFAYQIENMFALFDTIFIWLFWLLALIAFLLSYSLINSSIQTRQKEIGILRSLGATKWDTAKIFIFEGGIIAAFQAAIGSLICYIGYVAMNHFVFVKNFGALAKEINILDFVYYAPLLVAGLAVVSVGLGVMFPLFKFFKQQPVDVIRAGKKE